MDFIFDFLFYAASFIVLLGVLVFVHEWGHFWVARRNGVRVDIFSIGMGPEIFGWNDRKGTRWKIAWIPIGGYVKFFGDKDPASTPDTRSKDGSDDGFGWMSAEERAVSFHHKTLLQRSAIVAAGPIVNFIFALILLTGLNSIYGYSFTPPKINGVTENSAAAKSGLKPGDEIMVINGTSIARFKDISERIQLNPGVMWDFEVLRDGKTFHVSVLPETVEVKGLLGRTHKIGLLGISAKSVIIRDPGPVAAFTEAVDEVLRMSTILYKAVGKMIRGAMPLEDISGPVAIAQASGKIAELGLYKFIWFMAILSVNLGVINLLPIPALDGGHLLYYLAEAIRGKALAEKVQEYGFKLGLTCVLTIMLFVVWNDLYQAQFFNFFADLFS